MLGDDGFCLEELHHKRTAHLRLSVVTPRPAVM